LSVWTVHLADHRVNTDEVSGDLRAVAIGLGIAPAKLDIIERLARGPATMAELGKACGFTRHGVEPHLAVLEALGLVASEVARVPGACRPTRVYELDSRRLEDVRWALHDVLDFSDRSPLRLTA
jgi:DNA-binding transcriptional ArsR family regulator